MLWRRGWDSNPRNGFPFTAFPVLPIQPLLHLSGKTLPISDCPLPIGSRGAHRPTLQKDQSEIGIWKSAMLWRRGWDSNPRWALTHSGFRDRCTNPLCDLSVIKAKGKSKKAKDRNTRDIPLLLRPCSFFLPFAFYLFTFYWSYLLALKNSCINSRHSGSSTPLITSTRWFR